MSIFENKELTGSIKKHSTCKASVAFSLRNNLEELIKSGGGGDFNEGWVSDCFLGGGEGGLNTNFFLSLGGGVGTEVGEGYTGFLYKLVISWFCKKYIFLVQISSFS